MNHKEYMESQNPNPFDPSKIQVEDSATWPVFSRTHSEERLSVRYKEEAVIIIRELTQWLAGLQMIEEYQESKKTLS